MNQTKYPPGTRVTDPENENSELIVLNHKSVPIRNAIIFKTPDGDPDITVGSENQDADQESDTIEAVYVESLNDRLETWDTDMVLGNYTKNDDPTRTGTLTLPVKVYSFPASRLKPQ